MPLLSRERIASTNLAFAVDGLLSVQVVEEVLALPPDCKGEEELAIDSARYLYLYIIDTRRLPSCNDGRLSRSRYSLLLVCPHLYSFTRPDPWHEGGRHELLA